jgi:hypothetical protein
MVKSWFSLFHAVECEEKKSPFSLLWHRLFDNKETVQLDCDIHMQSVGEFGVSNVTKYRSKSQILYIKHIFTEQLGTQVKPKMDACDIDMLCTLDKISIRCYVLVYVKNQTNGKYDKVLFLEDYEAIKGIGHAEASKRLVSFEQAAKTIRTMLTL